MPNKEIRLIRRDVPSHWVGDGFPVRSMFSYNRDAEETDPFLLLDYAAPYEFEPTAQNRGVGGHPHKGFETVTIVYQGELAHRDSAGNHGTIGPGDVQWMTAASGLVHEEFHSDAFTKNGGTFEVIQLWVNLPAAIKKTPPRYQEILAKQIPTVRLEHGTARIIAGNYQLTKGPAQTFTPVHVWDLKLEQGETRLPLHDGFTAMLVVRRGHIMINNQDSLSGVGIAFFERNGNEIALECTGDAEATLLCGQPIGEPIVGQGPFVMNTQEEIRQAYLDFQRGAMGQLSS
jgi:quercetin 2,3-dioxygenase